jgi:hypothetical protein
MPRTRRLLMLPALMILATACGGGGAGPPANPNAAGTPVEVGGWYPAQVLLVQMTGVVEKAGGQQSKGWTVTTVAPGACTLGTAVIGKEFICVGFEIRNGTDGAGALDLKSGLPMLADSSGQRVAPVDLRIADMDFVGIGGQAGSVSSSTNCTFSAPDAGGRQQGQCTAMIAVQGGTEGMISGWAAVGAGKTARLDFAFLVPSGKTGWAVQWPDGTWFALP